MHDDIVGGRRLDHRRLVEAHVDVAHNIARGLFRRYGWMLESEDIDACAMLGLCEAATRFDRTRAEPFIAFAEQRIRGAVLDELRRFGHHGRTINQRLRKISAARVAIVQNGGDPTDEDVAMHLGLSLAAVRTTAAATRICDDDVATLPSLLPSPETHVEYARFMTQLVRARITLSAIEETIIGLRYDMGVSLAQVARTLELTLGRVRHVHASALTRLRCCMCDAIAGGDSAALRDAIPFSVFGQLEATCGDS